VASKPVDDVSDSRCRRTRDGRTWRIGTQSEVAWIAQHTLSGMTIASAIPPVFAAYATMVVSEDDAERIEQQRETLRLLSTQSGDQP
jgi:hypothetical protein